MLKIASFLQKVELEVPPSQQDTKDAHVEAQAKSYAHELVTKHDIEHEDDLKSLHKDGKLAPILKKTSMTPNDIDQVIGKFSTKAPVSAELPQPEPIKPSKETKQKKDEQNVEKTKEQEKGCFCFVAEEAGVSPPSKAPQVAAEAPPVPPSGGSSESTARRNVKPTPKQEDSCIWFLAPEAIAVPVASSASAKSVPSKKAYMPNFTPPYAKASHSVPAE